MRLEDILKKAIDLDASDIHLTVGIEPMGRVNSRLVKLSDKVLDLNNIEGLISELLDVKQKDKFIQQRDLEFSYDALDYRFRVNLFKQRGSPAGVMRIIPNEVPRIGDLGLPSDLDEMLTKPRGLFLVTGPTGSGKSTTLASMVDQINRTEDDKHIITLEDPIEYRHRHNNCIVNQRAIGEDTGGFAVGLRAALRQDPDIIMVGEMRDLKTISTAITAAETGHLVLATLHTNGAAETINRVVDSFPPHQQNQIRVQLSIVLLGVLSQQLLPSIGSRGMVVATEYMVSNPAVKNLIREGKTHQIENIIQTGKNLGMHTMKSSLKRLYKDKLISYHTALARGLSMESLDRMAFM
ncbi:type IV pilus twitching motility protein PilT [Halonatronum saccharophilum]|uniref:type IV pilus twitching motility protein PilT n=1 Tax=Halonatronum saccharophilum TaxID=150060 RepID=UPI000481B9FB|nr:type IV pilus twitching motility protein PilT [Halonatronum saccharophilum]